VQTLRDPFLSPKGARHRSPGLGFEPNPFQRLSPEGAIRDLASIPRILFVVFTAAEIVLVGPRSLGRMTGVGSALKGWWAVEDLNL